jgi:hypothetical protein
MTIKVYGSAATTDVPCTLTNPNHIHIELGLWCLTPLSTYFSYIVTVSFIGGGNQRKPVATQTNFIT